MQTGEIETDVESEGCAEHGEPECLCDVVITNPAPVNFGLLDLPYAKGVVRRLGHAWPWRANAFAEVMEWVMRAHDLASTRSEGRGGTTVERRALIARHSEGLRIAQVTEELGISFEEWRDTLVPPGSPTRLWCVVEFVEFERRVLFGQPIIATGRRLGLNAAQSRDLADWMGLSKPAAAKRRCDTSARGPRLTKGDREVLAQLVDSNLSPAEVVYAMKRDLDVTVSRSYVSHFRRRRTQKGPT